MKNTHSRTILTVLLSSAVLFFANGQKQAVRERIDPLIETGALMMVKGTVTAFNHYHLMNAQVTARKTGSKAFTDTAGRFEILAPGGDVLLFKAKGFRNTRREVPADAREINVNMILMPGKRNEEKAAAFGHMHDHDLAYAREHYPNNKHGVRMYSDLRGLVQAKLLDATVTDRGSIKVFVRGRDTSRFGWSENKGAAMFIVDGMFVHDIDFLNPWDIKYVRLLKGPEATMRYGSRGVNGVVLIDTGP